MLEGVGMAACPDPISPTMLGVSGAVFVVGGQCKVVLLLLLLTYGSGMTPSEPPSPVTHHHIRLFFVYHLLRSTPIIQSGPALPFHHLSGHLESRPTQSWGTTRVEQYAASAWGIIAVEAVYKKELLGSKLVGPRIVLLVF